MLTLDQPGWLWGLLLLLPLGLAAWRGHQRMGRTRWILAGTARALLLICVLLALAGLAIQVPVNALGVIFVVDTSASVGPDGRERALDFVRQALKHQGPEDQVGIVVTAGTAMVEAAPRRDLDVARLESTPSPHHSDLAAGIRLASAVLPADRTRRIVVISDGEETRGDAAAQVLLTAGEDLQISTHTLPREIGPEVLVEDVLLPPRVDESAPYDVRVVARTTRPTDGTLRLYRNDTYLGERRVHLEPGSAQVLTVKQSAEATGLYRYRAVLQVDDPGDDTIPQNNEAIASIQVTGRPRILLVDQDLRALRHLALALEKQGLSVDLKRPEDLPAGLTGLRPWAAVVLSDVPAYLLTTRQQEALESYVRDLGRGLAMLGGDESFGVGGYYNTPIERALPVDMDLKDKTRFPKLGMVIALDKSCSMGGGAGSKLDMAKEASIMTSELLQERDLLGVIGFDSAASWIVRLQPLTNKRGVQDLIGSVRPGGGTDVFPAIKAGVDALDASDAALKHIIVLSDFITNPADFKGLLTDAQGRDITITTLAFGSDADRATMQDLATWGGGQAYLVTDAKSVPAIFARETLLASRSFLVEEPFRAVDGPPSDLLEGLSAADLPTLYGYVATEPKRRALVPLVIPSKEEGATSAPLLAHGRYGLGRSLAFTSDATTRWAADWVGTPSYTRLWTQAGRWLVADAEGQDLDVAAEIREGELVVTVDAFDENGDFRNFLTGEARIVAPDLTVHPVGLRQVGPGRYQAELPVDQDGAWLASVALYSDEQRVGKAVAEAVQPWSPEYRVGGGGGALMAELARLGGGGELTDPAALFARPETPRQVPWPIWPHLLWLAALLLLLDVASRRLELSRSGPQRAGQLVPAGVPIPVTSARTTRAPVVTVTPSRGDDPRLPPPEPAPPSASGARPADGSYTGRLLAARKRAGTQQPDSEEDA